MGKQKTGIPFFHLLSNFIQLRMQLVSFTGKPKLAEALHVVSCEYFSIVQRCPTLQIRFTLSKTTK